MNLKIVVIASDQEHWFFKKYLAQSCSQLNLELIVVEGPTPFALRDKIFCLYNYLKDNQSDEVILFADAYDSLFVQSSEIILNKFREAGEQIIFSTEKTCHPDKKLMPRFPSKNGLWRFLNSGGFIGWSKDLYQLLGDVIKYNEHIDAPTEKMARNDQYIWTRFHLSNPDRIKLDYNCSIFQSILWTNPTRELDFSKSGVVNRKTGHDPCMLHFNGGCASLLNYYADIPWRGKFESEAKTPTLKTRMLCLRSEIRHRVHLGKFDLFFVKGLPEKYLPTVDKILNTIRIR